MAAVCGQKAPAIVACVNSGALFPKQLALPQSAGRTAISLSVAPTPVAAVNAASVGKIE